MWGCDWYNRFGQYLAVFAAPSADLVTLYRSAESIREVYQEPLLCGKTKPGQQILYTVFILCIFRGWNCFSFHT